MVEENTEQHLAQSFLAGDPEVARLVSGWARLALVPFRGRLGDEVEDLAQEVLAETVATLRRGISVGSTFRGLVWRIAARSAIDRLRRHQRWRFEGFAREPAGPDGDQALERLLAIEQRHQLLAVVSAMPRACRELWAWILEGLSYLEMSARVGVSEGALRVRVLRCRRRAQALIRSELPASPPNDAMGRRS